MHLENTQDEFSFHADLYRDLLQYFDHAFMPEFADACVMNYMRSILHREQPSRYGQGLDAPIQISRLSLQNWCTRAEEVCFPCPCLLAPWCVCVCGECDVLIRAEFLIPGDRAAHPHELNNGCPLQQSTAQQGQDRTVQDSLPVLSNLTGHSLGKSWQCKWCRCPAVCI